MAAAFQLMTGWCSWLSHPPDIAALQYETAGGPEFEPRINHGFFENKSGFPSLGMRFQKNSSKFHLHCVTVEEETLLKTRQIVFVPFFALYISCAARAVFFISIVKIYRSLDYTTSLVVERSSKVGSLLSITVNSFNRLLYSQL